MSKLIYQILVFTTLLTACGKSKNEEITMNGYQAVNAFITLNNNIDGANREMIYTNGKLVDMLAARSYNPELNTKEKATAKMWYQKAITVHGMCRRTANFFVTEADAMLAEGQSGVWIEHTGDGFYSIIDLNNQNNPYSKKDDYEIPTKMFVGEKVNKINDRGIALKTTLENYRDSLCILIADKTSAYGTGNYSFNPPKDLIKEDQDDTTWLDQLAPALENVKPSDHGTIKEIYRILTVPERVLHYGEEYPWQAGQFDHTPIVAATAIFSSIKSKVIQAERVALTNIKEQVQAPPFKFNKIEPLTFSNKTYINQGETLNMRVVVAAYDSTSATQIRYWVDDSTFSDANMLESYKTEVTLTGGVGEHVVYGQIAVETRNGKEWKSFKPFRYAVGKAK